jgi:alanine racemase
LTGPLPWAPALSEAPALPPTRAEIHLERYVHNIQVIRGIIGAQVDLIAVVKADAYGHGAITMADHAQSAGVSMVAVYTLDEGIRLRRAGIECRILILGPIEPARARQCVDHALIPCIGTPDLGQALSDVAVATGRSVRFHLEVDTGLNRYGVSYDSVVDLVRQLDALPGLNRESMFTHFGSADELEASTVGEQLGLFAATREALKGESVSFEGHHAANSAAALRFAATRFDAVRCGIATYGYTPSSHVGSELELRPVMAIGTELARVHEVAKGVGVSYGFEWRADRPSIVGLVPFGYADGMPRSAQNGGFVLIQGHRAPIIGRVAMDQFMVDLTDLPDCLVGTPVTIIGRDGDSQITADDIAAWTGTISYEILCRISPRVPRVYLRDGRPISWLPAFETVPRAWGSPTRRDATASL